MPPVRGHHHMTVKGLTDGPSYRVFRTQSEALYEAGKLRDGLRQQGYDLRGSLSSGDYVASKPGERVISCEWWRCEDEDCREWRAAQQTVGA